VPTSWAEPSQREEEAEKGKEAEEKEKRRKRGDKSKGGNKQTNKKHKFWVSEWCFGHDRALLCKEKEGWYLDVGAREDPHPAVMLSFIPVLINLLVDVHNVPLLQRKLL